MQSHAETELVEITGTVVIDRLVFTVDEPLIGNSKPAFGAEAVTVRVAAWGDVNFSIGDEIAIEMAEEGCWALAWKASDDNAKTPIPTL